MEEAHSVSFSVGVRAASYQGAERSGISWEGPTQYAVFKDFVLDPGDRGRH